MEEKLEELRNKYWPESSLENQIKRCCHNKYEAEDKAQEKKKLNFFKQRSSAPLLDVVGLTQFRLSLMSILRLSDSIIINDMNAKTLRNQVRVVREQY